MSEDKIDDNPIQKNFNFGGLDKELDYSIKTKIENIVRTENQFFDVIFTTNQLINTVIDFIDDEKIKTIIQFDTKQTYFNNDQLLVIKKILETGLNFWSNPKDAQLKFFEDYENIPEGIKNEWNSVSPEFFTAAEEYQFIKMNSPKLKLFNNYFLDYQKEKYFDGTEPSKMEKIFSDKDALEKKLDIKHILNEISKSSSFIKIKSDKLETNYLNTSLNRILPIKYMIHLLVNELINSTYVENKNLLVIDYEEFKKKCKIALKDFTIKLAIKDTIQTSKNKKVSRINRNATSFPLSNEIYSIMQNSDVVIEDSLKSERELYIEIEKKLNQEIDKYDISFARFFGMLFGEFTKSRPFKTSIRSVLEDFGFVEFYDESGQQTKKSGKKIVLTNEGIQFYFLHFSTRNQFFNKDETVFMYNKIKECSNIDKIIVDKIITFYDRLKSEFKKPIGNDGDITFEKREFSEELKKVEKERNENLDSQIGIKINEAGITNLKKDSIKSIRLAVLGRLQDIGLLKWEAGDNFNEYLVNNEILKTINSS